MAHARPMAGVVIAVLALGCGAAASRVAASPPPPSEAPDAALNTAVIAVPPAPLPRCPPVVLADAVASDPEANTVAALLDAQASSYGPEDPCIDRFVEMRGNGAIVEIDTPSGPYRVVMGTRYREGWRVSHAGAVEEARRVIDTITWLYAHPELRFVDETAVGYGRSLRHTRTTTTSTLCLGEIGAPPEWCWSPSAPVDAAFEDFGSHHRDEGVDLALTLVTATRAERWLYRLPDMQVARAPGSVRPPAPPTVPWWVPGAHETRLPARAWRTAAWQPLAAVDAPDLGPLESRTTRVGSSDAVEVRAASDTDVAELSVDDAPPSVLCARVDDRWRCAAPREGRYGFDGSDAYVGFELFPTSAGHPPLAVARHEESGNGCCGDGSGSDTHWSADLFVVRDDRLERIGALRVGTMAWVNLFDERDRFMDGVMLGNFALVRPLGPNCFAVDAPITVDRVLESGVFPTSRRHPRVRRSAPVVPLPDEMALAPRGNGVPGEVTLPESDDERWEELVAPVLDWRGVWRVDGDRLVRVDRDPRGTCPAP